MSLVSNIISCEQLLSLILETRKKMLVEIDQTCCNLIENSLCFELHGQYLDKMFISLSELKIKSV